VLIVVEIKCLVDGVRKAIQAHQCEKVELEFLSSLSIDVIADFRPDLASQFLVALVINVFRGDFEKHNFEELAS